MLSGESCTCQMINKKKWLGRCLLMKSIQMTDEQLIKHRNQVEKDFQRLYRNDKNKGIGTPLYEELMFLNYICDKRNKQLKM